MSEVGERAGLDRTAVARAERPGYDPRASTLVAIAKALGVPVCELFDEPEARHPRGTRTKARVEASPQPHQPPSPKGSRLRKRLS